MIDSSIVWRMALGNLRKHWKGTLLTVFAGSIGAILIAISFVNYTSVQQSGKEWIETRLGPIHWRIIPETPEVSGFTKTEVSALRSHVGQGADSFLMLPYITAEAALVAQDNAEQERQGRALKSIMLMGFQHEDAARMEPERAALWKGGLGDDELILGERIAKQLGVNKGDAIKLVSGDQSLLMRVRDIVEERGLTGYRDSGSYTGNAIATEKTIRMLNVGADPALYPAILMGNSDPAWPLGGMFRISEIKFQTQTIKLDFQNKIAKMNTSIIIGLISAVAIVSSMLFMRQSLIMIADSRREMYGMFRAIGMSRRNVGAMFVLEALLIALMCALAGAIVGTGAGYGLVHMFYQTFSDELSRMTGEVIPIAPHITPWGAVIVFAFVFFLLLVISLIAAAKTSSFSIIGALRGETPGERSGRRLRFGAKVMLGIGLFMTFSHIWMAFVDTPSMDGSNMLWIALFWIAACCTVLFFAIRLLRLLDKPMMKLLSLIGMPPLSVMLAVKYPRVHGGRTYTIGLLFALVMMIISFTIMLMTILISFNDVNRVDQTIYGYGGYAVYETEAQRAHMLKIAAEDKEISEKLTGMTYVEPFMISFVENGLAQAIIPVSEDLLSGPELPLLERADAFKSDREAWEAIAADPTYIIVPHSYLDNTTIFPGSGPVKAGDTFTFPVYENKLRLRDEAWTPVLEKTFTIAGIIHDVAGRTHLNDLFGMTFVNPAVLKELRPYGFKWPNQSAKGYVLFRFDHTNIPLAQELEERFALLGVMGFNVPYLNNSAEQLMNKQLSIAFIGFTVFSALIGLMGLAIIQYRAVRERSKQVAMMRCVGVAGRQIYWMFMIEGFVIGAIGLLTGWAIGSTGSRLFIESALQNQLPFDERTVNYPSTAILLILLGLLLLSLLLNIAPAKAALKLKAADALRMNNE